MALDPYREIARVAEAELRAEFITAFNNSMAGREDTGRQPIAFVGELARTRTSQDKEKKTARRFLRDIQEMMRVGEMAAYVAETVIGAKSDAQIADIVAEIEAKTGLTLEEYAARIIGDKALQRIPGETDADYQRRILDAVAKTITDNDAGHIKPEYAGDPLAEIILRDAAYQALMKEVNVVKRMGQGAQADALVSKFADAGYATAESSAQNIDDDRHKRELRGGQTDHRDDNAVSKPATSESEAFFGKGLSR